MGILGATGGFGISMCDIGSACLVTKNDVYHSLFLCTSLLLNFFTRLFFPPTMLSIPSKVSVDRSRALARLLQFREGNLVP